MVSLRKMALLFLYCFIAVQVSVTMADASEQAEKTTRALRSAYENFEKWIVNEGGEKNELVRHLKDVKNYKIIMSVDGDNTCVEFLPVPLGGQSIRGGGGMYVVNTATGVVVSFTPYR